MKKKILLTSILVSSTILFSCGTGSSDGDSESKEKALYLEDNESDDGSVSKNSGFHNQGVACSQCHSFNIGGTIFKNLHAQDGDVNNAALNYYIVLKTNNGSYRVKIGKGTGNFNLNKVISSSFIPQVYDTNGKLVNSSSAPHQASYTDCNSCHTANGKNGAPGRIVSYSYYANNNTGSNGNLGNNNSSTFAISSFTATPSSGQPPLNVNFVCSAYDINGGISRYEFDFNSDGVVDATNTTGIVSYTYNTPGTYNAKCTAVNNQNNKVSKIITINVGTGNGNTGGNNTGGNGTGNTLTFTGNILPILQSAGCTGCHGWASSYSGVIQRINTQNPANSLILLKATNSVSHGGGQRFTTNSQEYQTILNWIQQGANQ